jgi:hypothetical protein
MSKKSIEDFHYRKIESDSSSHKRSTSFQHSCFTDKDWEPQQYSSRSRRASVSEKKPTPVVHARLSNEPLFTQFDNARKTITKPAEDFGSSDNIADWVPEKSFLSQSRPRRHSLVSPSILPSLSAIEPKAHSHSERNSRTRRNSLILTSNVLPAIPIATSCIVSTPSLRQEIPGNSTPRRKASVSSLRISSLIQSSDVSVATVTSTRKSRRGSLQGSQCSAESPSTLKSPVCSPTFSLGEKMDSYGYRRKLGFLELETPSITPPDLSSELLSYWNHSACAVRNQED